MPLARPASAAVHTPTEKEIEIFERDGVVCLRGVFDLAWIELLREAVEHAMARPSVLAKEYGQRGTGRFFGDYNMWKRFPAFRRFTCESPAAGIVAALMRSAGVHLYNEHLLVKEPGSTDAPTPWHHDFPYFRLTGAQICSMWVGLDRVTLETGAMSFVRGSHRWGKIFRPSQFRNGRAAEPGGDYADLPDIDSERGRYDIISYDLEPGDCTVHHALTLHAAGGNRSATVRRRALSIRYAGDDARWYARSFAPEEDGAAYVQLDRDVALLTGERLNEPNFPAVWPKASSSPRLSA